MMRIKLCYPKMVLLVTILFSIFLLSLPEAKEKLTTVTGTVYDTDSDKNDFEQIQSAAIVVEKKNSFEYYYIVPDETGKKLFEEVGNTVTAQGTVEKRKDSTVWITVKSWYTEDSDEKEESSVDSEETPNVEYDEMLDEE